MSDYLLSVCIPTANRKRELERQIERIYREISALGWEKKVEIVICDNTSESHELIDIVKYNFDNLVYEKNPENLGYARNVNKVLTKSSGKFCWLLSDDDIVFDQAIETLVFYLKKYPHSNYVTFDCSGSYEGEVFSESMYFGDLRDGEVFYEDGKVYLEKHWISNVFISINVFNRDSMFKHIQKYNLLENINEVFQNSYIGIGLVNEQGNALVVPRSLLSDNYGNKVYKIENINNVAVDKYCKLYKQLRNLKVPVSVSREHARELLGSMIHYGSLSVVYRLEFQKVEIHEQTYLRIALDGELPVSLRVVAFSIFSFLRQPWIISALLFRVFLLLVKRKKYANAKKELLAVINESATSGQIHSTY